MTKTQRFVEIQTVFRLRAHQKKERDDPVLIEPISDAPNTVVLHPPHINLLSPSSALVRQTLSPNVARSSVDADYRFNSVLWPDSSSDQDTLYAAHGHPAALSVMERIKDPTMATKNHLLVTMGASGSGKTFTAWGGTSIHARKTESDGLLPLMIDSLFRQYKHQVYKNSKHAFAVNVTLLQVNQNRTKPQDCQIHDLLQTPAAGTFSATTAMSALPKASALFGCTSAGKSPVNQHLKQSNASAAKKSSRSSHVDIFVQQDSVTSDYKVVNAHVKECRSEVQARETLQSALKQTSRLSNAKRYQSHVYATVQPILLDRVTDKIVQTGGIVGVLDMASYDNPSVKLSKQIRGNRSKETVLPSVNDGHAAVMHCLTTLQHNQEIASSTRGAAAAAINSSYSDDGCSLESQMDDDKSMRRQSLNLKKVPYRQHKLTMLLQPLFGATAHATFVRLIVTAYTGHRDFVEKKALMNDVSVFFCGAPLKVCTGLVVKNRASSTGTRKESVRPTCKREKSRRKENKIPIALPSDADDEGSLNPRRKLTKKVDVLRTKPVAVAPGIRNVSYSDSEDDNSYVPLPPPLAPAYMASVGSPEPSAPLEAAYAVADSTMLYQFSAPTGVYGRSNTSDYPPGVSKHFTRDCAQPRVFCGDEETIRAPSQSDVAVPEPPLHPDMFKFSPMKTLNDMVYASKKKGKQVIEKMSYPLPLTIKITDSSVTKPAQVVNMENLKLAAVNESLLETNDRLQKENEALRAALLNKNRESTSCESPALRSLGRQESSRSILSNRNSLIDNELFQFMTQVRDHSTYQ
ncbi:hypothetical protein MPSEU_000319900 [Mayamaea pseudoterrestris]|nr:hypothetical protein MPSEU_000319900 [Mayamaea pseudoterrestris]